jgi:hypothetical protein
MHGDGRRDRKMMREEASFNDVYENTFTMKSYTGSAFNSQTSHH